MAPDPMQDHRVPLRLSATLQTLYMCVHVNVCVHMCVCAIATTEIIQQSLFVSYRKSPLTPTLTPPGVPQQSSTRLVSFPF